MAKRTLAYYTEPDSWAEGDDGEMHQEGWHTNLRIERSAAGAPRILIIIEEWDGDIQAGEVCVLVEDANELLAPVLAWSNEPAE